MNSKGHLHINKYFAFVFMVFAVMSGVSDDYSEANAAASKGLESSYILRINHFLSQDMGKIRTHILAKRFNAFRNYVQHIIAAKDTSDYIRVSLILGVLVIALFSINNIISQNNIWRATVF